ncbi:MAG: hypothetical protein FWB93_02975 [Oscillospiraceae bacterium]|nr:hypothetical protein [Oscillospiraceae bacterium]
MQRSKVKKGQGRGVSPHTRPPCPLTHYGDLLDGCAIILSLLGGKATDTAQGAANRPCCRLQRSQGLCKKVEQKLFPQKHEMLLQ